jgi:pimeloyl-ACP methyl ester carboxylesterase
VGVEELSFADETQLSSFAAISDNAINENRHFVYPVFKLKKEMKSKGVIILLHGLNERSWNKYLPWAERLALETGKLVVLFPISFHMNRAPGSWSDPRAMMPFVDERRKRMGNYNSLTYVNLALSDRLTDSPFRFYSSGKQTVLDVMSLVRHIKDGGIPYVDKGASVDIFAYSIGGFLSQVLLMANPDDLFSDTKLFLFCSGAVFGEMDGNSRTIMDEKAFGILKRYFETDFHETESKDLSPTLNERVNQAFKAMLNLKNSIHLRESFFEGAKNRIRTISLKKDIVIPTRGIVASLGSSASTILEEIDFPYSYSHENPFPDNKSAIRDLVNASFNGVFYKACSFLS